MDSLRRALTHITGNRDIEPLQVLSRPGLGIHKCIIR